MSWYYADEGVRRGPVSPQEFQELIQSGRVRDHMLVWTAGMPEWKPLAQVADAVRLPPPLPGLSAEPGGPAFAPAMAAVRFGGFWQRVLARMIDGFILWFVGQILGGAVVAMAIPGALKSFVIEPGEQPSPEQMMVIGQALLLIFATSLVVGLVYDLIFLRSFSATPGKMALGLKVKKADGTALSVGLIIGRHFAQFLSALPLGVGYLLAAFDPEKRALHDHVCGTRVVQEK